MDHSGVVLCRHPPGIPSPCSRSLLLSLSPSSTLSLSPLSAFKQKCVYMEAMNVPLTRPKYSGTHGLFARGRLKLLSALLCGTNLSFFKFYTILIFHSAYLFKRRMLDTTESFKKWNSRAHHHPLFPLALPLWLHLKELWP